MSRVIAAGLFGYAYFSAEPVFALSAEYKCTSECTLCINFDKRTVCSERYADDSEEYEKGKKLSRFVNDGLINPSPDIKQGFSLNAFANKFFNCEFMIKKAEQIKQAAENMCVRKTVKRDTYVNRVPASTREDDERPSRRGSESSAREKSSGPSMREIKRARRKQKTEASESAHEGEELSPPPKASENMDDLIRQMDE
jgi:hypothetical protein